LRYGRHHLWGEKIKIQPRLKKREQDRKFRINREAPSAKVLGEGGVKNGELKHEKRKEGENQEGSSNGK